MTDMQSMDEWLQAMSQQIGRGIEQARGGKSDQWVSDRTTRFGDRISRTAISEYRRGKRRVMPVTDLLQIAAALGVPPVAILFPDLPDGRVELLQKNHPVCALDALLWVIGERQTIPQGVDVFFDMETMEPGAVVEGRQDYRNDISYYGIPGYDLRTENDKGPIFQLLEASRELAETHKEFQANSKTLTDIFNPDEKMSQKLLQAEVQLWKDYGEKIKTLESKIEQLGGVIAEEKVTPLDFGG